MLLNVRHILCCLMTALLLWGCQKFPLIEEEVSDVPVVLELNVDVADVPAVKGYEDPESSDEMMKTLRIIIARPDGIVEHNRFLDFSSDPTVLVSEQKFEVAGNEKKSIFLIANEANAKAKAVRDFSTVVVGGRIDAVQMRGLTFSMSGNDDDLGIPVPMSAFYEVQMPMADISRDFHIHRAAVKFTYILNNRTEYTYDIDKIIISKSAAKAYFFPDIISMGDYTETYPTVIGDENNVTIVTGKDIYGFNVPVNPGYYDFTKEFDGHSVYGFKTHQLPPVYVLEGQYSGAYQTTVVLNGREFTADLPNLPNKLPRNTHVVVRITVTEKTLDWYDLEWQVDVRPYAELPYGDVELEPGFGL